jgi:ribonuclease J
MQGARIYDDVHVSGHLSQEGHYEMLRTLQPHHVIPAHNDLEHLARYIDLAEDQGYELGRDVHASRNGNVISLVE